MSDAATADRGGSRGRAVLVTMVVIAALLVGIAVAGLRERVDRRAAAAPTASTPGATLDERQARGTSLPGVGRLRGLAGPCTAWLVGPTGLAPTDRAAAPAHVLTAGRCTGVEDAVTVLSRVPVEDAAVDFALFAPRSGAEAAPVTVPVRTVAWAGVRGTDLALLRLDATYGALAARGVPAIDAVPPAAVGQQLLVAGVPVSGVADVHLRGSRCQLQRSTDVVDGPWLLRATGAIDCAGILEGSIGSPALDAQGRAVGLVATTTIGATSTPDCALGRPCEVGGGSVAFQPDTSYLAPVGDVGRCLTGRGLRLGGDCPLEVPSSVVEASIGASVVPAGSVLEVSIAPGSPAPRTTLVGMLGDTDCWAEEGRRPAVEDAQGVVRVAAPSSQGLALLCVGPAEQPTPLRFTVSGSVPDAGGIELRQTPVTGGILVAPVPDPPEFSTFVWTTGPAGTTDCATAEGYLPFTGEPAFLEAADLPSTVCVIASDAGGTPSAPQAFQVG